MGWIIGITLGAAWFACGIWAYRIDKTEFPNSVVPGADELFSALLILGGPASLAAELFMSRPR